MHTRPIAAGASTIAKSISVSIALQHSKRDAGRVTKPFPMRGNHV
jgi:hypothetical protein